MKKKINLENTINQLINKCDNFLDWFSDLTKSTNPQIVEIGQYELYQQALIRITNQLKESKSMLGPQYQSQSTDTIVHKKFTSREKIIINNQLVALNKTIDVTIKWFKALHKQLTCQEQHCQLVWEDWDNEFSDS